MLGLSPGDILVVCLYSQEHRLLLFLSFFLLKILSIAFFIRQENYECYKKERMLSNKKEANGQNGCSYIKTITVSY